jgi:hypothetical protein
MQARKTRPVVERIMDKVRKSESGCWIFTGCKIKSGYGKIAVTRSKPAFAHRVMYEQVVGEIPEGYVVMHKCDNPSCVNPEHLSVGTQKENWLDARAKGRNHASPQVTPNYRYVNHYLAKRQAV